MARTYITEAGLTFWYWAIRHAVQVCNYFPCKFDGKVTSPFELFYDTKPDFRLLAPLFSVGFFHHDRDGAAPTILLFHFFSWPFSRASHEGGWTPSER